MCWIVIQQTLDTSEETSNKTHGIVSLKLHSIEVIIVGSVTVMGLNPSITFTILYSVILNWKNCRQRFPIHYRTLLKKVLVPFKTHYDGSKLHFKIKTIRFKLIIKNDVVITITRLIFTSYIMDVLLHCQDRFLYFNRIEL